MVLIKDNHVAIAGGVAEAIRRAKAGAGHMVKIELEVDTIDQLREAMDVGVDAVLLDNITPDQLGKPSALSLAGQSPRRLAALRQQQQQQLQRPGSISSRSAGSPTTHQRSTSG